MELRGLDVGVFLCDEVYEQRVLHLPIQIQGKISFQLTEANVGGF